MMSQRPMLCPALAPPCWCWCSCRFLSIIQRRGFRSSSISRAPVKTSQSSQHLKEVMHSPGFHCEARETKLHVPLPYPVTLSVIFWRRAAHHPHAKLSEAGAISVPCRVPQTFSSAPANFQLLVSASPWLGDSFQNLKSLFCPPVW